MCANEDYENANGLPLSDCIKRAEIFEYNKKRGISNYFNPFVQLTCVYFNNAPLMGDYWIQRGTDNKLTIDEIKKLKDEDVGFGTLIYTEKNPNANPHAEYYHMNATMQAHIEDTSGTIIPANNGIFRLPVEDINGRCNTLYGARYMEGG